jgi:hypothetical protein
MLANAAAGSALILTGVVVRWASRNASVTGETVIEPRASDSAAGTVREQRESNRGVWEPGRQRQNGAVSNRHMETLPRPEVASGIKSDEHQGNRDCRRCLVLEQRPGRFKDDRNHRARNRDIHRQRDQTADVFVIDQPAAACDITQQQSREDGHKRIKEESEHDDASALLPLRFHERTNGDARFPRCFRLGRCKPVAQISAAGAYIIDCLD